MFTVNISKTDATSLSTANKAALLFDIGKALPPYVNTNLPKGANTALVNVIVTHHPISLEYAIQYGFQNKEFHPLGTQKTIPRAQLYGTNK